MGRAKEALDLMKQATSIEDDIIGDVFAISSESQRAAYLKTIKSNFNGFLSLVLQHLRSSPTAVRTALDLVLRRKAIEAEALATQRDAVLLEYPALEPKLRKLTALRMQIAQKVLAGPGPDSLTVHQRQLAEWNDQRDHLEAELAREIPEMQWLPWKFQAADRRAVARALPAGSILIEFIHLDVFDFQAIPARGEKRWKPPRYLAFIVPAGKPDSIQMIDVGEAEPIDQLIIAFRNSIISGGERSRDLGVVPSVPSAIFSGDNGVALRELLFDPVVTTAGGWKRLCGHRKRLFLAPDGNLAQLPFQVLPLEEGRYLIDQYRISYLSAGRDILRFGIVSSVRSTAPLVLADPDFDLVNSYKESCSP
jgi:hypothetical protein